MKITYQSNMLGEKDENKFFSIDESLISHLGGKKVWLFGIIENIKKEFHLEASFKGDETTIKIFISKFVDKGNTIFSDGWQAYSFLGNPISGFNHITHVHASGNFGLGFSSTSHKGSN